MSNLLQPAGVAVIGASNNPAKLGYRLISNIVTCGYQGGIYPVNPHEPEILGYRAYPDVESVPGPVDMAFLLVPAHATPAVLDACGRRGIKSVIVGSGGFRECGQEGARLEKECVDIVRSYGMEMIGPNCIGLINMHVPLQAVFLPPPGPIKGDLAFISQSGAICAGIIDVTRQQGAGLSVIASLGNEADLTETDLMDRLLDDTDTRSILLYIESIREGHRFIETAQRVGRDKPLVALKVGRYASGKRAAASHTGAMAGADEAYTAAFRKAGVAQARDTRELLAFGQVLAWCRPMDGPRVAVLSNAGGPGVTGADALEGLGLRVPLLSNELRARLAAMLDPAASTANPIDMIASATPEQYAGALDMLLNSSEVDAVIVVAPPPPSFTAMQVAKAVNPVIHAHSKPVLFVLLGGELVREAELLTRKERIPVFTYPEEAARALLALYQRGEFLRRESAVYVPDFTVPTNGVHSEDPVLEAQDLVSRCGIGVAPLRLARTATEAVSHYLEIDAPVVLKIASRQFGHKSDIGGVLIGLDDIISVEEGFGTLITRGNKADPFATVEGVYVQQMAPAGQDLIVGMVRDPQFGPLMMVGSGGVEAEIEQDVQFALAPLSRMEAEAMIDGTRAGRRLRGYRNIPPSDREAAVETLLRLSALALAREDIAEIEINPLRVLAPGAGAIALDVRARFSTSEKLEEVAPL